MIDTEYYEVKIEEFLSHLKDSIRFLAEKVYDVESNLPESSLYDVTKSIHNIIKEISTIGIFASSIIAIKSLLEEKNKA